MSTPNAKPLGDFLAAHKALRAACASKDEQQIEVAAAAYEAALEALIAYLYAQEAN